MLILKGSTIVVDTKDAEILISVIKDIKEELGLCLGEAFDCITISGGTANEIMEVYSLAFKRIEGDTVHRYGFNDTRYTLIDSKDKWLGGGMNLREAKELVSMHSGSPIIDIHRVGKDKIFLTSAEQQFTAIKIS